MKSSNILLVFFSFFLFSTNLLAQYEIGIRAGLSKAWQNYGDIQTPDDAEIHIRGENISLFAYKKIGERISIGIEPSYTTKGARCVPGFDEPFIGDTKFILQYMETPFMVQYAFPVMDDKIHVYGKLGYGVGFLHKAYREDQFFDTNREPELTEIILDKPFHETGRFNRFEHSLYGGLGLSYSMNRNTIRLEGNYNFGLSNATRFTVSRNRGLAFSLGYGYSF